MAERKDPPYFEYFPGNYRWSAAFINMISSAPYGGSEIGELHKIGHLLKGKDPEDDEAASADEEAPKKKKKKKKRAELYNPIAHVQYSNFIIQ